MPTDLSISPYAIQNATSMSQVFWTLGVPKTALLRPSTAGFRPPQWGKQKAALTLLPHPLPGPPVEPGFTDPFGRFVANPAFEAEQARLKPTIYVFDSVIRADHETQSVVTLNPVQNGSPIADHAYVMPPRLTVEIAMSDSMQSYTVGQWGGGKGELPKSYNAYQTLVTLQRQRMRLTIETRMQQYDDMLITEIRCEETHETRYAGKFIVTFTRVVQAMIEQSDSGVGYATVGGGFVSDPSNSSRFDATAAPTGGPVQPGPIPPAIESQNVAPILTPQTARLYSVPGAGRFGGLPIF